MSETATATESTRPLVWSRLNSLLGLLPLGVWTINHLWDNLAAYRGADAWQTAVTEHQSPFSHGLTLFIVLAPLVLHTIWGLQRIKSMRPNNRAYPFYENLKYLLQRLSALGLLAFLGAHIWLAMLQPRLFKGRAETFAELTREMHFHTPTLVVYLLGTLAVSYHLANGISGFAWSFGLTTGRKSFRGFDKVMLISLVLLLGMSWGAIYALYRAGAAFGP